MERKVWPMTKVISRLVNVLMAVPAARFSLQQHEGAQQSGKTHEGRQTGRTGLTLTKDEAQNLASSNGDHVG
jgi:hypothetical protein